MRILAVVAYVGLIFTLSTWKHPPSGPEVPHFDKLEHTVEYGILGLLILWAAGGRGRGWRGLALVVAAGLVVAMVDESIQGHTPGRDSSAFDILADLVGLGLAWVVGGGDRAKRTSRSRCA
jgi:VanZ family protein